jgi:hypothetical protein
MSFTCYIKDKNGINLLEKYNISSQLRGIGPNLYYGEVPHTLDDIINIFINYKELVDYLIEKEATYCLSEISRYIVNKCQDMIKENIDSLKKPLHFDICKTCSCKGEIFTSYAWFIEESKKFLSIPIHEVYVASCSY